MLRKLKPSHIVKKAAAAVHAISADPDCHCEKPLVTLTKNLNRMEDILYRHTHGGEPNSRALRLVAKIDGADFVPLVLDSFLLILPEQRRQFTHVFTACVALQIRCVVPGPAFLSSRPDCLDRIMALYERPELVVYAGEMLRICTKHEPLARMIHAPEHLDRLFSHFNAPHFDLAADSFATFRELILNSPIADVYMKGNLRPMMDRLHETLVEGNYAPCRQTLKLIGELIMAFEDFQKAYLADEKNLIAVMKLMLSGYRNIAMEAFHIFKLFVVREEVPEPILRILRRNSEKLKQLLRHLLDQINDDEIQREKEALLLALGDGARRRQASRPARRASAVVIRPKADCQSRALARGQPTEVRVTN
jgi:calcium binding protein 39